MVIRLVFAGEQRRVQAARQDDEQVTAKFEEVKVKAALKRQEVLEAEAAKKDAHRHDRSAPLPSLSLH